jgi:DNA-binding XRE family transcriptional regulator
MDNLRFDSGVKRLLINDGPDVLEFNPSDVVFAEKFYRLMADFEQQQAGWVEQAAAIDAAGDEVAPRLELLKTICAHLHAGIDDVFGPDSSRKLFGGAMSLDAITEFLTAIAPIIAQARQERLAKYRG